MREIVEDDSIGRRINLFCIGFVVAAMGVIAIWFSIMLLTMMMNPQLNGDEYWKEVRERIAANHSLDILIISSSIVTLFGIAVMIRAIFYPRRWSHLPR